MKIEFKKVPQIPKTFTTEYNSVKIEGTFCKMSPSLVKVDSTIKGQVIVQCIRCAKDNTIFIEEEFNFLISDGIFKSSNVEDLVIETNDSIINFDDIIQSEISSVYSDYHICNECINNDLTNKKY